MYTIGKIVCSTSSLIAGVLYPTYASYKSLKTSSSSSRLPGELERWSMYWSTVASLSVFETFVLSWTVRWWFPLYAESRCALILWLVLPQTQGSTWLYERYFEPFLFKHELEIDRYLTGSSTWFLNGFKIVLLNVVRSIRSLVLGETSTERSNSPRETLSRGVFDWISFFNSNAILNQAHVETPRLVRDDKYKTKTNKTRSERRRRLEQRLEQLDQEESDSESTSSALSESSLSSWSSSEGEGALRKDERGSTGRKTRARKMIKTRLGQGESGFELLEAHPRQGFTSRTGSRRQS
ncbi:HVA22/TB2/DP1 family protein [Sporobolomyces koalae]|uniref:HVA22/TB2/DP1 family protein n=1 Tax=Sporobolomyces koalae TaxID=500713 RepID=UPI00316FF345